MYHILSSICAYKYSAHLNFTMIFCKKKYIFVFENNFTRNNHCKFIHHKSHFKPFLSYLPCIVHREYFSIIFNVKKCALYSITYGTSLLVESRTIKETLVVGQKFISLWQLLFLKRSYILTS